MPGFFRKLRDKSRAIIGHRESPEESLEPSSKSPIASTPASGVDNLFLPAIVSGRGQSTPPKVVNDSRDETYKSFKAALEALNGPAGLLPPLKIVLEGISSIATAINVRVPLARIITS